MNALNEYNKSHNRALRLIDSISNDDFSRIDYDKIKECSLFKWTRLINLNDYLVELGYTGDKLKEEYSKYDYVIKLVQKHCSKEEVKIYRKSKVIIDSYRYINVKLYSKDFLDLVSNVINK